jgi:hypothetical protein
MARLNLSEFRQKPSRLLSVLFVLCAEPLFQKPFFLIGDENVTGHGSNLNESYEAWPKNEETKKNEEIAEVRRIPLPESLFIRL